MHSTIYVDHHISRNSSPCVTLVLTALGWAMASISLPIVSTHTFISNIQPSGAKREERTLRVWLGTISRFLADEYSSHPC